MEKGDIDKIFRKCSAELERKIEEYGQELGKDYTPMGEFLERLPTEVCFTLMLKHVTVLKKAARDPMSISTKTVEHRVMDLIDFAIILQNEIAKYKETQASKKIDKVLEGGNVSS